MPSVTTVTPFERSFLLRAVSLVQTRAPVTGASFRIHLSTYPLSPATETFFLGRISNAVLASAAFFFFVEASLLSSFMVPFDMIIS